MAVGGREGGIERAGGHAGEPQRKRGNRGRRFDAGLDRRQDVEAALRSGELAPAS